MKSAINLPNAFSLVRALLAPICAYLLFLQGWWLVYAGILFACASATDLYDGYFARKYGLVTEVGSFLDPFADKLLMGSVFYAFWKLDIIGGWFILLVFGRDLFVTLLRIILVSSGKPLQTSKTAKWKTFLQIVVVSIAYVTLLIRTFSSDTALLLYAHIFLTGATIVIACITVYSAYEYLNVNKWLLRELLEKWISRCEKVNRIVMRSIATLGSLGYIVKAPGSMASLLTCSVVWVLPGGLCVQAFMLMLTAIIGGIAAHKLSMHEGTSDPGHIIIDEVVGMWLILLFIPKTIIAYGIAFLLFRLFDIAKIPPVNYVEEKFSGGLGIMLDDIAAGLCALLGAKVILLFL